MLRITILCCGLMCSCPAQAQDIAGIEDCTKTSGLDKRTGCLQSNINLLQQLLSRNSRDCQQRISAALNEIVWRTQTTDFWVSFKLFGAVPLTFIFGALQMPLIKKYSLDAKN